jgi:hypothetical protein
MTDEAWRDPEKGPSSDEVAFDYIKGPDFRVVYADGAIGGLTPSGMIHFALFAERQAIPRRQVFKVDANSGELQNEVEEKLISRGSVVRELALDVFMTPKTARNLANFLVDLSRKVSVNKRNK